MSDTLDAQRYMIRALGIGSIRPYPPEPTLVLFNPGTRTLLFAEVLVAAGCDAGRVQRALVMNHSLRPLFRMGFCLHDMGPLVANAHAHWLLLGER